MGKKSLNFKSILKGVTEKGLPAVGGGLAEKLTKNIGKKIIKDPAKQKFIPALPIMLAAVLMDQKGWMEYAGVGMFAVAGTEVAGTLVPALAGLEDMDLSGIFGESDEVSDELNDELNDDVSDDIEGTLDGTLDGYEDY